MLFLYSSQDFELLVTCGVQVNDQTGLLVHIVVILYHFHIGIAFKIVVCEAYKYRYVGCTYKKGDKN
jgi:hypothetical protein